MNLNPITVHGLPPSPLNELEEGEEGIAQEAAGCLKAYRMYCYKAGITTDPGWIYRSAKTLSEACTNRYLIPFMASDFASVPLGAEFVQIDRPHKFDSDLNHVETDHVFLCRPSFVYASNEWLYIIQDVLNGVEDPGSEMELCAVCMAKIYTSQRTSQPAPKLLGVTTAWQDPTKGVKAEKTFETSWLLSEGAKRAKALLPGKKEEPVVAPSKPDLSEIDTEEQAKRTIAQVLHNEAMAFAGRQLLERWCREHGPVEILVNGKTKTAGLFPETITTPKNVRQLAGALASWGVPKEAVWKKLILDHGDLQALQIEFGLESKKPFLKAMLDIGERNVFEIQSRE